MLAGMGRRGPQTMQLVAAIVVIGVGVVAAAWLLQRQLIYLPGGEPAPVATALPGAEAVTLTTPDGLELEAWYLERGPAAVLVLPGNAGNRGIRAPLAEALADLGLSVLLLDYRGYGGNPGAPTEDGLLTDARTAADWLEEVAAADQLVLFGESLGSGVAVSLAHERAPAAVVLRSPFPSLVDVARQHYGPVPEWLLRDRFPTADRIGAVDAPVLVVAATEDAIVPLELSRRVHDAAGEPSRFVTLDGVGHNDRELLDGPQLIGAIEGFLRDHGILDGT